MDYYTDRALFDTQCVIRALLDQENLNCIVQSGTLITDRVRVSFFLRNVFVII